MSAPPPTATTRRSLRLLAWAALPVLVLASIVQVTGIGIDILVLAAAALVLVALQRSVGDLLGEWFGPLASAMILVLAAGALFWYFLADRVGRSRTDSFFAEAERRGYRTAYYQPARPSAKLPAASPHSPPAAEPVATGGSSGTSSPGSGGQASGVGVERSDVRGGISQPPATPSPVPGHGPVDTGATRSFGSLFRRRSPGDPAATQISISVSPQRVEVARRAVIAATVLAGGTPVTVGTVEFTVNGMGAGRVAVNREGLASTTFLTHIPGSYEVRARYAGSNNYATSTSRASLNVAARR